MKATVGKLIEVLKAFPREDIIDLRGVIAIENNTAESLEIKESIISISKEITNIPNEICKYNDNGYLIYRKYYDAKEEWMEYDDNGNVIYRKKSDGLEEWLEYNDKNQCAHLYTKEMEFFYLYDENGEFIKSRTSIMPEGRFQMLRNKDKLNCI